MAQFSSTSLEKEWKQHEKVLSACKVFALKCHTLKRNSVKGFFAYVFVETSNFKYLYFYICGKFGGEVQDFLKLN